MKKNKMMRVASGLMVAVLMTTSAISGTFAKYVTETSKTESARVAKFGVILSTSGTLFGTDYEEHDSIELPDEETLSVKGDGSNVCAPGTCSAQLNGSDVFGDKKGLNFNISGKPEVAVKVSFDASFTDDIYLKAYNTTPGYTDYTTISDPMSNFTVSADYHPIKFTLSKGDSGEVVNSLENVTLNDIVSYLHGNSSDLVFNAGTDLGTAVGKYTLSWKWDFTGAGDIDKYDTFLGMYAADSSIPLPAGAAEACTDIDVTITMTVTQID